MQKLEEDCVKITQFLRNLNILQMQKVMQTWKYRSNKKQTAIPKQYIKCYQCLRLECQLECANNLISFWVFRRSSIWIYGYVCSYVVVDFKPLSHSLTHSEWFVKLRFACERIIWLF